MIPGDPGDTGDPGVPTRRPILVVQVVVDEYR